MSGTELARCIIFSGGGEVRLAARELGRPDLAQAVQSAGKVSGARRPFIGHDKTARMFAPDIAGRAFGTFATFIARDHDRRRQRRNALGQHAPSAQPAHHPLAPISFVLPSIPIWATKHTVHPPSNPATPTPSSTSPADDRRQVRAAAFDADATDTVIAIKQAPFDEQLGAPRPVETERRELIARAQTELMIQEPRVLQVEAILQIRTDVMSQRSGPVTLADVQIKLHREFPVQPLAARRSPAGNRLRRAYVLPCAMACSPRSAARAGHASGSIRATLRRRSRAASATVCEPAREALQGRDRAR